MNNCTHILEHLVDKSNMSISYQSHKKVDWICDLGHNFSIDVCKFSNPSRSSYKKFNCPYCVGQKVFIGFNDLESQRPDIASQ